MGGCITACMLGLGDHHQDNMLVLPDSTLCFIDASFLGGESPGIIDTPYFPLPLLFKQLMVKEGQREAFKELCWEALQCLRDRRVDVDLMVFAAGSHVQPSLIRDVIRSCDYMHSISQAQLYGMIERGPWLAVPKNLPRVLKAWQNRP